MAGAAALPLLPEMAGAAGIGAAVPSAAGIGGGGTLMGAIKSPMMMNMLMKGLGTAMGGGSQGPVGGGPPGRRPMQNFGQY
jgi:hypothetical protein